MNPNNKAYLERFVQALGSLKLSFALLAVLCALAAQKALQAQSALGDDAPRYLRLLVSLKPLPLEVLGGILVVVFTLLVVNLVLSSARMVRKVRIKQRAFAGFKTGDGISALENRVEFTAREDSSAVIAAWFRKGGFRVTVEQRDEATVLHAGRRATGLWGMFLFHASFMILLLGILLSMLTGFAGYVALSPGDVFVEKQSGYMRSTGRPLLFGRDRFFKVRLDRIDLDYWSPGHVRQRASVVGIFASDGTFIGQKRMEINQPISMGGTMVYQGGRQGFAAELAVADRAGTSVKATARFLFPAKPGDPMKCVLPLPGTDVNLLMELVTDRVREIPGLESLAPRHPVTMIKLTTVENGPPVFRGVMFPGTGLGFEGLKVGFIKLKPFSSLVVKRDYGVPVIFASFIALVAGLLLSYYWVPENWWVASLREGEGYRVQIGATIERYRESFSEDFGEKVAELAKEVCGK